MRRHNRSLLPIVSSPFFPKTYLFRNLGSILGDPGARKMPLRLKRAHLRRIVEERTIFFLHVRGWLLTGCGLPSAAGAVSKCRGDNRPEYCNRCGACCEIASGLPDFPCPEEIPGNWRDAFGEGLGRGHRFCAFLWEYTSTGGSLCSIHPWRPNPCRSFEIEECDYLTKDPRFMDPRDIRELSVARRWLIHLIDGRKLPGRRPNLPAKRPEFLKFNGI